MQGLMSPRGLTPPAAWLAVAIAGYLLAAWLLGGVTEDPTSYDEVLQLLALPLLVAAVAAMAFAPGSTRMPVFGWCALAAIIAVPLLQLMPLPAGVWDVPDVRRSLLTDLTAAGVDAPVRRWTLAPAATERALWSLLPGVAPLLATLLLTKAWRRRLVQAIVAIIGVNLLFGFFQVGLPRGSNLLLYPNATIPIGGLLIHFNHQATALLVAMACLVGLGVGRYRRNGRDDARWLPLSIAPLYLVAAVGCILLMPLTTSRAGVALALPVFAAALWLCGALPPLEGGLQRKRTLVIVALVAGMAAIGAWSAIGWMAVDSSEEVRAIMRVAAIDLGMRNAPLGSGIGSFVPMFAQHLPKELLMGVYVNHAHNEYAQWWLTGGVLALIAMALSLYTLGAAGLNLARTARRERDPLAAGAFVAVAAVLVHSWVEYPLRTPALLATTAILVGVLFAGLKHRSRAGQASPAAERATAMQHADHLAEAQPR